MTTLASVDLPAPLGPMSAWTSPSLTTRSTPRRMDEPSACGVEVSQFEERCWHAEEPTGATSND